MTHQHHFRSDEIDTLTLYVLARTAGKESKAEYLRDLIRADAAERGIEIPVSPGEIDDSMYPAGR